MTIITESFNTADSDTLGPDLTWSELRGDVDVVSNRASNGAALIRCVARAEHDLSGSDNYAQANDCNFTNNNANFIICCRFSPSAETYYALSITLQTSLVLANIELRRVIANSDTVIASEAGVTVSLPLASVRVEADGSTIRGLINDVEVLSVTGETGIVSGTRSGVRMFAEILGGSSIDSFEAGDLAVGTDFTRAVDDTLGLTDAVIVEVPAPPDVWSRSVEIG